MTLETLLQEAEAEKIEVIQGNLKGRLKGLYIDNVIVLASHIKTNAEKACILAEELGHHYTTEGNILDQSKIQNRKQERRAQRWAHEKLIPLDKLVGAHKTGAKNLYELAECLNITEEFLAAALVHYKEKHGSCCRVGRYWLFFEPLGILELFE